MKSITAAACLMSLIITMDSCSFSSKATRRLLRQVEGKSFEIIVVPGVPFKDGSWSRTMKARVYWSKYLYDRGIAKNVMYSGSAVYSPYKEGEIMALYGEAIGIPKEHIFYETKAEHSTENIYYGYKKARELGFSSVALASDPFQTKMLRKFTRKKVSDEIALIPIVMDTLEKMEPLMADPQIDYEQAFVQDFIPLTERESFWQRLKGTAGKNINFNQQDQTRKLEKQ